MRARFIRGRAGFTGAARSLAFGALLVCVEHNAGAADALPFALSYEAAPTCPPEAEFRALLDEKLSAAPGEDHSAISGTVVRLSAGPGSFIGRLELTHRDGTSYSRDISAASCAELAAAIAFVVALASRGGDETADFQASPPPPPAPPPTPQVPPLAAVRLASPPRAAARPKSGDAWGVGGGVLAGVRTGLGPTWTFVEGAGLELRAPAHGALALAGRVDFSHSEPIVRVDRYGSSLFAWNAGTLELCPARFEKAKPLSVVPCWGTELGLLRVTGRPTLNASSRGRLASQIWLAGSPLLRLELQLVRHVSLQAQGQVILSFTQYRFVLDDPDTPVYRVPEVAVAGQLGLSLTFP